AVFDVAGAVALPECDHRPHSSDGFSTSVALCRPDIAPYKDEHIKAGTLTGHITISNIPSTKRANGLTITIELLQDSTGSRTIVGERLGSLDDPEHDGRRADDPDVPRFRR